MRVVDGLAGGEHAFGAAALPLDETRDVRPVADDAVGRPVEPPRERPGELVREPAGVRPDPDPEDEARVQPPRAGVRRKRREAPGQVRDDHVVAAAEEAADEIAPAGAALEGERTRSGGVLGQRVPLVAVRREEEVDVHSPRELLEQRPAVVRAEVGDEGGAHGQLTPTSGTRYSDVTASLRRACAS